MSHFTITYVMEPDMDTRICVAATFSCSALLLAGCAGISVSKAPPLDQYIQAQGAPWNLAMTQFTVTISRHITKCGTAIDGRVETVATASTVSDPDQRYLLTSNGWFATSDIKSTLSAQGYNIALNSESVDSTAEVIGNVVGTAAHAAIFMAAGGAPIGAPPEVKQKCQPAVASAVDKLYPPKGTPSLKDTVETATSVLAQQTATVALLSAQAVADKTDKTLRGNLIKALSAQDTARQDLEAKQGEYDSAVKLTTDTQTVVWPSNSSEVRTSTAFSIDTEVLKKWLVQSVDKANAALSMDVFLALYVQPEAGGWNSPMTTTVADLSLGVPIRVPRPAKLLACTAVKCPDVLTAGQALKDNQTATDFTVLQLGPLYALPVSGGAFRSESASITLDANANPSVLQTTQKVSGAAALTGATEDAATQLSALPASLRAAKLARTKAEADQIEASTALHVARRTSDLQGSSDTLNAQTALINAQNAYSAAKQNASIQGLQQDAGSINAQAAVLQAQAVLVTAHANNKVVDQTSTLGAQTTLIEANTALLNATAAQVRAQTAVLP